MSQPAGRALILLVVPPAASTDSATYAMGGAAAGHVHDDPARLLAEAGVAGDGSLRIVLLRVMTDQSGAA